MKRISDKEINKLCLDNRLNLVPIEIIARKIAQAQLEADQKKIEPEEIDCNKTGYMDK